MHPLRFDGAKSGRLETAARSPISMQAIGVRRAEGSFVAGPLMNGLDADTQAELLAALSFHAIAKHELIHHAGRSIDRVQFLVHGAAMAWKSWAGRDAQVIGFMFPGNVLGALTGPTHQTSARAIESGMLASVPVRVLGELIDRRPMLAHAIYRTVSSEFALAQDHLTVLGAMSATERLAATLLQLERRQRARGYRPDVPLWLPMRRTDLASYLGLELPTLSRSFRRLRTAKLIACHSSTEVLLRDRSELARLARDASDPSAAGA